MGELKLAYDTPVLIRIVDGIGTYIPELKTYVPLETYASVVDIIQIMNRGIYIDFPKQSKDLEITKAIELLMVEYMEALEVARAKKGNSVGTDINVALDVIGDINDTKKTIDQHHEEINESNIFKSDSEAKHIMETLLNNNPINVFDSDEFIDPDQRVKNFERERKVRKLIEEDKAYMTSVLKSEAEAHKKIVKLMNSETSSEYSQYDDFMDLDLDGAK